MSNKETLTSLSLFLRVFYTTTKSSHSQKHTTSHYITLIIMSLLLVTLQHIPACYFLHYFQS